MTLTANSGGGLDNSGAATLMNVTVSDNSSNFTYGAGVYNSGTLTAINVTLSGNMLSGIGGGGFGGGGLANNGTANLANVTISNNQCDGYGGGVYNSGSLSLTNVTIAGNTAATLGGGIFNSSGGTAAVANSIIAGNNLPALASGLDVAGTFASKSPNLVSVTDGSTGWLYNDRTGTLANPLRAMLARLDNYGGSTQTQPPLPGSPAVGGGAIKWVPGNLPTDQRGLPRTANGAVDLGAVELQTFVVNSTDDTLDGSIVPQHMTLRDAVFMANSVPAPSTIAFDNAVFASPQTIDLTGGALKIKQSTAIIGPTVGVTLDAKGLADGFDISPGAVSMSSLTLANAGGPRHHQSRQVASHQRLADE